MTENLSVHKPRLARVRELMRAQPAPLHALLVRATDGYLNEYVPAAESLRIWLSGFTGSVGDVVVTADHAYVFADGRYHLQAEAETDPKLFEVVKVSLGSTIDEAVEQRLVELARKHGSGFLAGFEAEKVSVELARKLLTALEKVGGKLSAPAENLVSKARAEAGAVPTPRVAMLLAIPEALAGESALAKLVRLRAALVQAEVDGILLTRLDEIAWLTNLRGLEIDFSMTFRALAWVGRDAATLFVDPEKLTAETRTALAGAFDLAPEQGWAESLETSFSDGRRRRVLLDPAGSSQAVRSALATLLGERGEVIEVLSPVMAMKAKKNPRELAAMAASFERADAVVAAAIAWCNKRVGKGKPVNEAEFAEKVEELFREAGALALSFRVISAAGPNGAVIHYSHPDRKRRIKKGELMLLDTGAYFEAGYATDLTRTFLAGGGSAKASPKQKLIYTLVLKASIRGMKARFPVGTTGLQLDAIVRAPIWEAGFDYLHGTGHGVGVLVHEAPPRVATRSTTPLEPFQVFSIEPGIYLAGWGGVRIENLVTVVEDPKVEGFLRVKALTFSPLDRRLIDPHLLSADEKAWLRQYHRGRG